MKSVSWQLVRLRPVEENDLSTIQVWQNTPALRDHFVGYPFPINESQVRHWWDTLDFSRSPRKILHTINYGSDLVGLAALSEIDWVHRTAQISLYIGVSELHGVGLGKAVISLLADYAFSSLNLWRLHAQVADFNTSSVAAFSAMGFREEGTLREAYFLNDCRRDIVLLGLLSSDPRPKPPSEAHKMSGQV